VTDYRYRTERLTDSHNRAGFSCGVEALDRYFRERAGQDLRRNLAVAYLLTDSQSGTIVGYYTLSSTSLLPQSLPAELAKKLPHYRDFPAVLLGRLAVDSRYHGQGFGGLLLQDALQRCVESGREIGIMAVVVDAIDDAAGAFYEHFGFRRLEGRGNRLYLPITDVPLL
jgi:GNAT superfamily N-acetyltransferase